MAQDLQSTIALLGELPKHLTLDRLVQVNEICYLPVKLIHTNQVTVKLSQQEFIKTTAHNAISILSRKRDKLKESKKVISKAPEPLKGSEPALPQKLSPSKQGQPTKLQAVPHTPPQGLVDLGGGRLTIVEENKQQQMPSKRVSKFKAERIKQRKQ